MIYALKLRSIVLLSNISLYYCSYISGPGTSYRGYEIKIMTTDGPSWIVPVEVSATASWKKFHEALRTATWGAELCANEFEESFWPALFNRFPRYKCFSNSMHNDYFPG